MYLWVKPQPLVCPSNTLTVCTSGSSLSLWSALPTPSVYVPHLGPASAFGPPFQHSHCTCMYLWVKPQPLVCPSNTLTVCTSGSSLSLWSTLPTPSLYVPPGPASAFGPPFQHPQCMYLIWVQPQPLAHPFNTLTVHVCTSGSSLSLWSALPTPSLYVPLGPASAFGPPFQHPHCMYLWVQPQPLTHPFNTLTVHVCTSGSSLSLWSALPTPSLYVPLGPASAFGPPFQHPHCMYLWVQPQPLAHPFNTLTVHVCTSGSSLSLWSALPTPSLYVPLGPASAFGPPFQHSHCTCMYLWVKPQPLVRPSNTLTVCTSGSSLSLWPTLPTPSLYVPLGPALAFGPPFQHPHCMNLWVQPQPLTCPFNTLTVCTSGSSLSLWPTLPTPSLYVPLGPASAFDLPFQHPHCMYLWVQPQPLAHPSNTLTVCTSGSSLSLWSTIPTPSLYVPLGQASAFGPPFQHPHCMYLWVQPQPLTRPFNTLTVCTSGSSLSFWSALSTPSLYAPLGPASAFGPPFQHPHCMYLWVQPQPLAHPFNTLTVHVCTSGSSLSLWSALPTPSLYVPLGPASAFGPPFQHPHCTCMYLWVKPQPLARPSNTLTVCTSGSSLSL